VNGRSWGFNVSEPDTHLTYMINIALTTEFTLLPIAAIAGSSLRLRFRSGGDR